MADLVALILRNTNRWKTAKLTRGPEFGPVANRLVAAKSRYQTVAKRTGVPWFVIAVIHEREAAQSWSANIAQGDPWGRVSVHVPKGRGPFQSWDEAAIDALTNCAPHAANWKDWSPGGTMTLLEMYNGLGYANKGLPSPYIWSGTDQYQRGKYVADGVFDPEAIDKQLGCAGLIMAMQQIDQSIKFGAEPITLPPDTPPAEPKPEQTNKAGHAGLFAAVAAAFSALADAPWWAIAGIAIVIGVTAYLVIHFMKKGN